MPADVCRHCGGEMRSGIATGQTVTGRADFPGDREPVTLSPGGPGYLRSCLKCATCGWSVTAPAETPATPTRGPRRTQDAKPPQQPAQAAPGPSATVCLPYPPSSNRLWRTCRGKQTLSAEADRWKKTAGSIATAARVRRLDGPVAVSITLHPRRTKTGRASRTRIDLDNCIKATLDALNRIAWTDDKQVARILAEIGPPIADGGLTVSISIHDGF